MVCWIASGRRFRVWELGREKLAEPTPPPADPGEVEPAHPSRTGFSAAPENSLLGCERLFSGLLKEFTAKLART
jgi:hypothetical protein